MMFSIIKKVIVKEVFLILAIMTISSIAFAGTMTELSCDSCGYKSKALYEGVAGEGYSNSIVYCEICKNFYAIPTKIVFETDRHKKSDIPETTEKEKFLGKERLVYRCPKCGGKAFTYDGPLCPICKNGRLHKRIVGVWD